MRATSNRPISDDEAACIRVTLERAPAIPNASVLTATIVHLRVVGGCDCGCASVDFEKDSSGDTQPIADATGRTARGGDVGIIVWGTSNAITGLEVYDLGAGEAILNEMAAQMDEFALKRKK
jgi:hypothetical protein